MSKRTTIFVSIFFILIASVALWFFIGRDKTMPTGEAVRDLLPFGSGDGFDLPGTSGEENNYDPNFFNENGVPVARLFKISDSPVAGGAAFTRNNQTIVRYVERATGHVVEVSLPKEEGEALGRVNITNTTMPKIYEAYFRPDGAAILMRSLRNDGVGQNIGITLTPPTSTSTGALHSISAANFRGDIGSVGVGTGNTLFYSLKDSGLVVSSQFDASNIRTLFNGAFTEWKVFSSGNNAILQTKTAYGFPGFAYTLNATSGSLTKILGPIESLAIKPNRSGSRIAYSYTEGGESRSATLNVVSGSTMIISPATFAEKCAWREAADEVLICAIPIEAPAFGEPDLWYQGKSTFSDRIWQFDTDQEIAEAIVDPKALYGVELDAIDLKISPLEDYMILTNKKDYTLWALKLEE